MLIETEGLLDQKTKKEARVLRTIDPFICMRNSTVLVNIRSYYLIS